MAAMDPVLRAAPTGVDTQIVIEEGSTAAGSTATPSVKQSAAAADTPTDASTRSVDTSAGRASPFERIDIEEDSRLRNWKQGESLGRGAYGEVYKAMVAGRFMAVKKIPLERIPAEKEINTLLHEINTLKRLKHPRIVRYIGCIRQDSEEDPALLIFLEYIPTGSIKTVLQKFGAYGLGLARKYTRQILEGLEFLHTQKPVIIHRDVKGANILIDTHGDAKLADFGASHEMEALQSTLTGGINSIEGSVYWMAPEVVAYKAGRRSDIWSLGCTVIEMITAEPPWPNLRKEKISVTETLKAIVEGTGGPPIPDVATGHCKHFLEHVLVRDHTKRPYARDLMAHRFARQDPSAATSNHDRQDGVSSRSSAAATEAWGSSPAARPELS
jgi:serine/threonine protein kinase